MDFETSNKTKFRLVAINDDYVEITFTIDNQESTFHLDKQDAINIAEIVEALLEIKGDYL